MQRTFLVHPGGRLVGRVAIPGDKSISHRAIMLGALAEGTTTIRGFLNGADCLATLRAFRQLGVTITEGEEITVEGVGLHGLTPPTVFLDMGNAGTAMRLLCGILAGQAFDSTLIGDESLSKRPMKRVVAPLTQMGAKIATSDAGTAPLQIDGKQSLTGIDYALPIASAQVKSCLLLAGLYATGDTVIHEPAPSRDHTEKMLQAFGYPVAVNGATVRLSGGGRLTGQALQIPGDISSAAFFMVGASISPGADVLLEGVGINPSRDGVLTILKQMGAHIDLLNLRQLGAEPVADIRIRGAALKGIQIDPALVPLAIDEFPAIFVAAACAQGETVLTGAAELRVKESDRIQTMADGLQILGIDARPTADGMVIRGGNLKGGEVNSHGDHRIAMAFAMAALRAEGTVTIHDCANVATSFPNFVALAGQAGLAIDEL